MGARAADQIRRLRLTGSTRLFVARLPARPHARLRTSSTATAAHRVSCLAALERRPPPLCPPPPASVRRLCSRAPPSSPSQTRRVPSVRSAAPLRAQVQPASEHGALRIRRLWLREPPRPLRSGARSRAKERSTQTKGLTTAIFPSLPLRPITVHATLDRVQACTNMYATSSCPSVA